MDKAKQAVQSFLSKDGKHDTTVHETVNPAVQNEQVTRTQQEDTTKAVDREVHQDHHHTSVQPIQDREVLPEEHHHRLGGVEHREIKHGDDSHIKDRLAADAAQFKNTRDVSDVQHSSSAGQTVTGEHVHHHFHEQIQPVIQKETIQPSVVHTTVPVHEVHHNEAKHHTASALPAMSMEEYKRSGGAVGGREERTDAFRGEPKTGGSTLGGSGAEGTTSLTENESLKHGNSHTEHNSGTNTGNGSAFVSTGAGTQSGSGVGSHSTGTRSHDSTVTDKHGKPSLMDKLNPTKDADHDGKAGFMK